MTGNIRINLAIQGIKGTWTDVYVPLSFPSMRSAAFIVTAAALLFSLAEGAETSCTSTNVKIDCLPGNKSPSEKECTDRSCCWQQEEEELKCTYPAEYPSYTMTSVHPHSRGIEALLERRGGDSGFPKDVQTLSLTVLYINKNMLRVKITDSSNSRFEPPLPEINLDQLTKPQEEVDYTVKLIPEPASFQITRISTGEIIFDTSVGGFIFADQFLQLSTLLTTANLYGIGEHHHNFNRGLNTTTYTLFNRGELVPGEKSAMNLYGSHPFYLALEKGGNVNGVFLHNSNAMDVVVQPSNPSVTFRTIGGVLDLFFFLGPSADEVVQQYTSLVGKPFLVPYWTLGFHLSRYGFNTTKETEDTWLRNSNMGLPIDTMWSDIDYMDKMKDWTFDPTRMAGLKTFIERLHQVGVHYIMNNSPGLSGIEPSGTYPPIDEAKELDILIRDYKGDLLEALVWQNVTYLLDFSNPKIMSFWEKYFKQFHEQVPFDAAWIDMNEPYSFHMGSLKGCPKDNPLDYPPYVPGGQLLYNGTICMSAQQHLSTHYNIHTIYAIMETIAMNSALTKILNGKRPFVLSRASSPGFGYYGAHWSGDIHSSWEHLKYSIPNMLNFNMYGIPMIGSDICGFVGSTTEELCTRWMQLGAFYPFSRNHNDFDTIPQDPASFSDKTQKIMKEIILQRYTLLPFFYTQMYHSHVDGSPAVRPLFFDYPKDNKTYDIETQFLWANSLMVIPVLDQGATKVSGYLPAAQWYDYFTGQKYDSDGKVFDFDTPIEHINVLVKEGSIIPQQKPATTTETSRINVFWLLAALNKKGEASGSVYWDDGESIDSVETKMYNIISFSVQQNTFKTTATAAGYSTRMDLEQVTVYGVEKNVTKVTLNTEILPANQFTWSNQVLTVQTGDRTLLNDITITWESS